MNLNFAPTITLTGIAIKIAESIEKKIAPSTRVTIAIAAIVLLAETRASLPALWINVLFL